uniref:Uncharacterized protein n=1 Tax=Fundidesulfovibrio putealis TaxID=270496 RepID=A0A7C4AH86_9BACT
MARKALLTVIALLVAFSVPAYAQKKSGDKQPTPMSQAASAASVSNFGQRWAAMGEKERDGFLEGMVTAFRIMCLNAVMGGLDAKSQNAQEADKKFKECMVGFFPYQMHLVRQAMTELYQDKANNAVPFDVCFGVALLKIKGDPYEENLAKLRQDLAKRGGK